MSRRTPKPLASLPVYSRPTSQAVPAMSRWAQGVSPTNSSRKAAAVDRAGLALRGERW